MAGEVAIVPQQNLFMLHPFCFHIINEFRISNEDFSSQICCKLFFAQVTLMTVQGIAPTSLGMTAGGELLVQILAIT